MSYYDDYATSRNTHMFKAVATTATLPITVRVIDSFGNVSLRSISRPHAYSSGMESDENVLIQGDVNSDGEVTVADVNVIIDLVMGGTNLSCPPVLVDCNGDNEINLADVNAAINRILNL